MNIKQMPRVEVNAEAMQLRHELQTVSQMRDQLLRLLIGAILKYGDDGKKLSLAAQDLAHLDLRRLVIDIEQVVDGNLRLSIRDQLAPAVAPAAPPALAEVAVLPAALPIEESEEIEPPCECTHMHNEHVARVGGCKYCECDGYRAANNDTGESL